MDILYLGVAAVMGLTTVGLLKLCERLKHDNTGKRA
jgi:hypothetical protein